MPSDPTPDLAAGPETPPGGQPMVLFDIDGVILDVHGQPFPGIARTIDVLMLLGYEVHFWTAGGTFHGVNALQRAGIYGGFTGHTKPTYPMTEEAALAVVGRRPALQIDDDPTERVADWPFMIWSPPDPVPALDETPPADRRYVTFEDGDCGDGECPDYGRRHQHHWSSVAAGVRVTAQSAPEAGGLPDVDCDCTPGYPHKRKAGPLRPEAPKERGGNVVSIYGVKDDTSKRSRFKPDGEWHDLTGQLRGTKQWFSEFPVPEGKDFWIEVKLGGPDTETCPGFKIISYRVEDGVPDDKSAAEDKPIVPGRVKNKSGWDHMYHHFLNGRPGLTHVRVAVRVWGSSETLRITTREIKIIPVD